MFLYQYVVFVIRISSAVAGQMGECIVSQPYHLIRFSHVQEEFEDTKRVINQKLLSEEEQTTQWPKDTKGVIRNC